jgi:hypothetical protein
MILSFQNLEFKARQTGTTRLLPALLSGLSIIWADGGRGKRGKR